MTSFHIDEEIDAKERIEHILNISHTDCSALRSIDGWKEGRKWRSRDEEKHELMVLNTTPPHPPNS